MTPTGTTTPPLTGQVTLHITEQATVTYDNGRTYPVGTVSLAVDMRRYAIDDGLNTWDAARFTDNPYGRLYVSSEHNTYPENGYVRRFHVDTINANIQVTGNPDDQIAVTVGQDDWRTTVTMTGVIYGEQPSIENDDEDE